MDLLESNISNLFKLPVKARNQIADAFFYDIGALTGSEIMLLNTWVDRQGAILVVSPRATDKPIRRYPNALRFMIDEDCKNGNVQALVVAGVGSSAIGTAALARNVADAYDFDVAGIVSGYGMANLVEEGMGGWFFYGAIDRFRYRLEGQMVNTLAGLETLLPAETSVKEAIMDLYQSLISPLDAVIPADLDTAALHDLMLYRFIAGKPAKLRLLVGHSKGNLLISYVLNHMVDELKMDKKKMPRPPFDHMAIVTMGAVVDIPQELFRSKYIRQFLGEWDLLGMMNSDWDFKGTKPHKNVLGAAHHLNRMIPLYMSVPNVLKGVALPDCQPQPETAGDGKIPLGWHGPSRINFRRMRKSFTMSQQTLGERR